MLDAGYRQYVGLGASHMMTGYDQTIGGGGRSVEKTQEKTQGQSRVHRA